LQKLISQRLGIVFETVQNVSRQKYILYSTPFMA